MKLQFGKILIGPKEPEAFFLVVKKTGKGGFYCMHLTSWLADVLECNNKIIEFLSVPNKKILGFRVINSINKDKLEKHTMKYISIEEGKHTALGLERMLRNFPSIELTAPTYKFPIEKYEDSVYGTVFYVTLDHNEGLKNVSQRKTKSTEQS